MEQETQYVRSDRKTFWGIKANPNVFFGALTVVVLAIGTTLYFGDDAKELFDSTQNAVSSNTGWFFIMLVNVLLVFTLYLGFGRYGKIRLGGKEAKPDFTLTGWFSMLFSAGMGIGLLFYSVAEPVMHYEKNPLLPPSADAALAAKSAMAVTFLHWGVHAWAIYAIVALALAFFTFNLNLPLTIRSIFYPLFGERVYGWIGDAIDIVSVIATIFGLATSLGVGVQQVNAGLEHLFGIPMSSMSQVLLIIGITFFATLSLVLGLDKGIRVLSEWNMRLAVALLVFLLIAGPTIFLLRSFVQNVGYYVYEFFEMSFWTSSYANVDSPVQWQNDWTVFYWSWWIAWSPFVGIFIARVSRGRTIREFVMGVLFVPTLLTFIWLSVFGGSALYQELQGNTEVSVAVGENIATAIYHMLEQYPFSFAASMMAVLLVASFFVTSSDSGSMVVDTLTSGGRHDAPVFQKIFWASMEGTVAAVLLVGGGLKALQTATILTGLPFACILIVMCFSLYRSLKDYYEQHFYAPERLLRKGENSVMFRQKPNSENGENKRTKEAAPSEKSE